jgi:hypothetical protein
MMAFSAVIEVLLLRREARQNDRAAAKPSHYAPFSRRFGGNGRGCID